MKRKFKKILSGSVFALCVLVLSLSVFADAPYWWKTERPFPNFTADNPPRVVDDGDFLTDEQESILSAKIESICERFDFSYVLFTDDDLHEDYTGAYRDYERENKYAADFLYFNGYGIGSNYSATVLFHFIVNEDDGGLYRGWTTISIGDNERLFTEERINYVDDIIEPYFRSGEYFEAYMKHAEYVEQLLTDMYELPEWYPEGVDASSIQRTGRNYSVTLNSGSRKVYDKAGLLSSTEAAQLENAIRDVITKTGKDVYLFTDTSSHSLYLSDYGDDFYYYNGGYRDGLILTIIRDEYGTRCVSVGVGSGTSTADSDLDDRLVEDWNDKGAYAALTNYVRNADYGLRHNGKMPIKTGSIVTIVIISLVIGLIFAGIRNSALMKGMKLVPQRYAGRYLRQGSLNITNRQDAFLYRTVSRVAKPRDTGSSGGGGRSSYGGGHSSGGGHYSGGGRHY
ncbi:MAG: TPM domain-containing protein [Clostridia bacterium]|nr:TPM domain-containing protein [Clostridia bacterium]